MYSILKSVKTMCHSIKLNCSGRLIMNSVKQFWFSNQRWVKGLSWLTLPFLLMACTAVPAQQATKTDQQKQSEKAQLQDEAAQTPEQFLPLTPEIVYYVLTAEIAGQRGDIGLATDLYFQAAESVDSPALANRAARVATFTRDQSRIARSIERWQEVAPNDVDVMLMRIPFLLNAEKYDEVVALMDKALALEPEKKPVYLAGYAEQLSQQVPAVDALLMMQQLKLYIANDADARFAYAQLATFYRQYNPALAEIDRLLSEQPDYQPYLILKAEILQRKGELDEAVTLLEKAATQKDANAEIRFFYGKLLGEKGESEKARAIFERLYEENPDNNEVVFALGLLALERGEGEAAKAYFTDLVKQGDPGQQAHYFLGLAEELNDNQDAALLWFASVPTDSPRFESAQGRYIAILADQGDVQKAREHLQMLRQQRPDRAVDFYLFEGSFLQDQQLNTAAMDLYNEAIEKHPQASDLRYARAMLAESMDDLALLEQDLRAILQQDPENSTALNALGYTLTDRTDRHDEALVLIERALALKPGDPFYLDSLGWVYYRLGDLDSAERYLRQAHSVQSDAEFGAHLGEVLWLQGKKREAKAVWQEALENSEDNKVLQETLKRFNQ